MSRSSEVLSKVSEGVKVIPGPARATEVFTTKEGTVSKLGTFRNINPTQDTKDSASFDMLTVASLKTGSNIVNKGRDDEGNVDGTGFTCAQSCTCARTDCDQMC